MGINEKSLIMSKCLSQNRSLISKKEIKWANNDETI